VATNRREVGILLWRHGGLESRGTDRTIDKYRPLCLSVFYPDIGCTIFGDETESLD
jgi:hypothetical protein